MKILNPPIVKPETSWIVVCPECEAVLEIFENDLCVELDTDGLENTSDLLFTCEFCKNVIEIDIDVPVAVIGRLIDKAKRG
jgi:hypothetical protein